MNDFLNYIGMIGVGNWHQTVVGIVRIVLAAILGSMIGLERGRKHRPAGVRTHTLVCVAAALVMVTNEQIILAYGTGDPTRMGAQVISGIGFLGAGTILTDRQHRIKGLTTAAGLWASACVGLAIGGGFYIGGIVAAVLILVVFTKLVDVEQHLVLKSRVMDLNVSFDSPKNMNNFISEITSHDCSILSFSYIDMDDELQHMADRGEVVLKKVVSVNLHILLPVKNYHSEVLKILENSKGMIQMEEL